MIKRLLALSVSLFAAASVSAEPIVCSAADTRCLAGQAILMATTTPQAEDGMMDFVVGSFCKNDALTSRGQATYVKNLPAIINDARANLQTVFAKDLKGFNDVNASLDIAIRAARRNQQIGIVAGLRSVFAMYPATQGDYCEKMVKSLTQPH